MVGTVGSAVRRSEPVTTRARTLPDWANGVQRAATASSSIGPSKPPTGCRSRFSFILRSRLRSSSTSSAVNRSRSSRLGPPAGKRQRLPARGGWLKARAVNRAQRIAWARYDLTGVTDALKRLGAEAHALRVVTARADKALS